MAYARSDHASYITAVTHNLTSEDITVDAVATTSSPLRRARIDLAIDQDDLVFTGLAAVTLYWQEDRGWWLTLNFQSTVGIRPTPIFHGTPLLPRPEALTAWVRLLLTHPETITTGSGTILRPPRSYEPLTEAHLEGYQSSLA